MSEEKTLFDADGNYTGPEELTITFAEPLKSSNNDTKPVDSITLKEPTAQQLSIFLSSQRKNDEAKASIDFIAANSGVPAPYIQKMKTRDFTKAMDFLGGFTPPEKKIGV